MSSALEEPIWLTIELILAVHDRQLAEHGGSIGARDRGALESTLARPINQWSYGETDTVRLAAALAFGIARNHPFVDGNKRTAWVAARMFLKLNGVAVRFAKADAVEAVLKLAAGELAEVELADWFRQRIAAA